MKRPTVFAFGILFLVGLMFGCARESENALTGKWVITSDEDEITGRYVYHFKADRVIDLIQYVSKEDAEPKSTNLAGLTKLAQSLC